MDFLAKVKEILAKGLVLETIVLLVAFSSIIAGVASLALVADKIYVATVGKRFFQTPQRVTPQLATPTPIPTEVAQAEPTSQPIPTPTKTPSTIVQLVKTPTPTPTPTPKIFLPPQAQVSLPSPTPAGPKTPSPAVSPTPTPTMSPTPSPTPGMGCYVVVFGGLYNLEPIRNSDVRFIAPGGERKVFKARSRVVCGTYDEPVDNTAVFQDNYDRHGCWFMLSPYYAGPGSASGDMEPVCQPA